MKKTLFASIFTLVLALPIAASAAAAEKFTDVAPGAWYYEAVDYAVSEGLFNGTSQTTFTPNGTMTRGMFVTVLANKTENYSAHQYAGSSFSDVAAGQWYAPPVEWAYQNKLVGGIGGGLFAPNSSLSREQLAVILYHYAKGCGADTSTTAGALGALTDNGNISGYARTAMEWAVSNKVLNGAEGKLDPKGTATRAQVAQILYNCRELLANSTLAMPDRVWVVDVPGHYETVTRLELKEVTVGEVGHWEDEVIRVPVYRCNQCGYVAQTEAEIEKHIADSIDWDNMLETGEYTGCSNYTQVASDPIYTGNKVWVIDVPGHKELQMVEVKEEVWIDEVGHWEYI